MHPTKNSLLLKPGEAAAHALYAVSDFGWLRPTELGRLLSPGTATSRKYAERLLRKLTSMRYVLPRKLPGGHTGSAYVLTTRGAAWLRDHAGDDASRSAYRDGTNWGRTTNGVWAPPSTWLHQLHVAGVLSLLHEKGYEVVSELALLRMATEAEKHADGIAVVRDKSGQEFSIWIEVERSRKTGGHQEQMLRAVFGAARGKPVTIYQSLPPVRMAYVAIPVSGIDERGYRLDHKARMLNRIKRLGVSADVTIHLLEMHMHGEGVCLIEFDTLELPSMPAASGLAGTP